MIDGRGTFTAHTPSQRFNVPHCSLSLSLLPSHFFNLRCLFLPAVRPWNVNDRPQGSKRKGRPFSRNAQYANFKANIGIRAQQSEWPTFLGPGVREVPVETMIIVIPGTKGGSPDGRGAGGSFSIKRSSG